MTNEPMIYIEGELGIRLEDVITVTEDEAENLTRWSGSPEEPAVVQAPKRRMQTRVVTALLVAAFIYFAFLLLEADAECGHGLKPSGVDADRLAPRRGELRPGVHVARLEGEPETAGEAPLERGARVPAEGEVGRDPPRRHGAEGHLVVGILVGVVHALDEIGLGAQGRRAREDGKLHAALHREPLEVEVAPALGPLEARRARLDPARPIEEEGVWQLGVDGGLAVPSRPIEGGGEAEPPGDPHRQ